MLDLLALAQSRKDAYFLVVAGNRNEHRDVLAYRFFGGVSEETFGTCVPTGDYALQRFADDRVFRRMYDRGEQAGGLVGPQTQRGKFVHNCLSDFVCVGFWIIQNATRERFMRCQKLFDVILKLDFRMHSGPVVCGPNECQEKQQVLKSNSA